MVLGSLKLYTQLPSSSQATLLRLRTDVCNCEYGLAATGYSCTTNNAKICSGCNPGFRLNVGTCQEINECEEENECDANAFCTNTVGSYYCIYNNSACDPGSGWDRTQESRDLKQLLELYENVRSTYIPSPNETDAWYEPLVALQRKILPPYNESDIQLADKEPRVAMATFSIKPWNLWGNPTYGPRGGLMYKDFLKMWQERKEIDGTIAKVNKMFIGAVLRWHADLFDMSREQTDTDILAPYDIVFFLDTPQHSLAPQFRHYSKRPGQMFVWWPTEPAGLGPSGHTDRTKLLQSRKTEVRMCSAAIDMFLIDPILLTKPLREDVAANGPPVVPLWCRYPVQGMREMVGINRLLSKPNATRHKTKDWFKRPCDLYMHRNSLTQKASHSAMKTLGTECRTDKNGGLVDYLHDLYKSKFVVVEPINRFSCGQMLVDGVIADAIGVGSVTRTYSRILLPPSMRMGLASNTFSPNETEETAAYKRRFRNVLQSTLNQVDWLYAEQNKRLNDLIDVATLPSARQVAIMLHLVSGCDSNCRYDGLEDE